MRSAGSNISSSATPILLQSVMNFSTLSSVVSGIPKYISYENNRSILFHSQKLRERILGKKKREKERQDKQEEMNVQMKLYEWKNKNLRVYFVWILVLMSSLLHTDAFHYSIQ